VSTPKVRSALNSKRGPFAILAVGHCTSKVLNAAVAGLECAPWILDPPISEKFLTSTPVVGDLTQD
ncbi:unnamed protein product, partial [Acidithrix sp. C25]